MGTAAELSRILPPVTEQRLSPRKRVSSPVPIELFPGQEVLLSEMSEGGLSVTSSSRLEVGAVARVNFQIPETDSDIDATGVVAWSNSSGRAGVRFTSLEPRSSAALARWLAPDQGCTQTESADEANTDSALAAKITGLCEIADLKTAISLQQLDDNASLETIVRRMAELTRATGAAIALREGSDVVCRACAGNAPDVGVKLSASSLSGECMRTGRVVLLEDSESDARVDPEICRQLNFRSLLIVPIVSASETVGIAEVLSPQPRNFEGSDILILTFLADLLAGIAVQNAEIKQAGISEFLDTAHFGIPSLDQTAVEIPTSAVSITETDLSSAREVPSRPERQSRTIATNGNPLLSQTSSSQGAGLASAPIPTHSVAQRTAVTAHGTAPAVLSPEVKRRPAVGILPIAIVAIVLLIAILALLFGYVLPRNLNSGKPANGTSVIAEKPVVTAVASPESSSINSGAAKPAGTATKAARSGAPHPSVASSRSDSSNSKARDQLDELEVVQRSTALKQPTVETVPDAPTMSQLTSRSNGMMPASIIAANTPTPELSPRQSQGVIEGKLVKKVLPRYPEMARRAGVSGDVLISATIGTDGGLHNLRVMSGSPLLREEALTAARQWRYSPYKLGGKPVETETRITVSFHR
jgi:TonB family protein